MKDRKISWEVASTAIAVIMLLAVMFWANGLFDGEPPEEAPRAATPAAEPAPEPAAEPERRRRKIPRPVVTRTGISESDVLERGDGATLTVVEGSGELGEDTAPPEDLFEPGDPALAEAFGDIMRTIHPDVMRCLVGWWREDPTLSGQVELEFILGDRGLSEVTLLDPGDAPLGPVSCFGTAVYDADWPAVSGEMVVVFPFDVSIPLPDPGETSTTRTMKLQAIPRGQGEAPRGDDE